MASYVFWCDVCPPWIRLPKLLGNLPFWEQRFGRETSRVPFTLKSFWACEILTTLLYEKLSCLEQWEIGVFEVQGQRILLFIHPLGDSASLPPQQSTRGPLHQCWCVVRVPPVPLHTPQPLYPSLSGWTTGSLRTSPHGFTGWAVEWGCRKCYCCSVTTAPSASVPVLDGCHCYHDANPLWRLHACFCPRWVSILCCYI